MSAISRRFAEELNEKEMRDAYLDAQTRTKLAQQIRALRTQRGWSQRDLGEKMGKPQGNIARLEDRDVARYTLTTLLDLASAFDIGLVAKFVTYEDFLRDTESLSPEALNVRSFNRDALNAFYEDTLPQIDIVRRADLGPSNLIPILITTFNRASAISELVATDFTIRRSRLSSFQGWLETWNRRTLTPSPNTTTYQVQLPFGQDAEMAQLRQALAESEQKKAALQDEFNALRAERDALRAQLSLGMNERELWREPVPIIDPLRYDRTGLI